MTCDAVNDMRRKAGHLHVEPDTFDRLHRQVSGLGALRVWGLRV